MINLTHSPTDFSVLQSPQPLLQDLHRQPEVLRAQQHMVAFNMRYQSADGRACPRQNAIETEEQDYFSFWTK